MDADTAYMALALEEARLAGTEGEVPIGSVIVCDGAVVARAHNTREAEHDPTAHAELIAIREASRKLGRWRLSDCTVYVTLEPCPMCAGAMHQARIDRLVYGAPDPKAGAVGTLFDLPRREANHRSPSQQVPCGMLGLLKQSSGIAANRGMRDRLSNRCD